MFKVVVEAQPDYLKECLALQKKHGTLSKALLVRKFKVSFMEAGKMLDHMDEVKE